MRCRRGDEGAEKGGENRRSRERKREQEEQREEDDVERRRKDDVSRRRRSQHEPDQSMPRRSSALKRGVVSWAWMLKKQEGHWFIWKEHRYRRPSRYQ